MKNIFLKAVIFALNIVTIVTFFSSFITVMLQAFGFIDDHAAYASTGSLFGKLLSAVLFMNMVRIAIFGAKAEFK